MKLGFTTRWSLRAKFKDQNTIELVLMDGNTNTIFLTQLKITDSGLLQQCESDSNQDKVLEGDEAHD